MDSRVTFEIKTPSPISFKQKRLQVSKAVTQKEVRRQYEAAKSVHPEFMIDRDELNYEDLQEDEAMAYPYVSNFSDHLTTKAGKGIKYLTPELHFTPPSAQKSSKKEKSSGKKLAKRDQLRKSIKPPLYTLNKKVSDFPNRYFDLAKFSAGNPETDVVKRHQKRLMMVSNKKEAHCEEAKENSCSHFYTDDIGEENCARIPKHYLRSIESRSNLRPKPRKSFKLKIDSKL